MKIEIGKKYTLKGWDKEMFMEVLDLFDELMWCIDNEGNKSSWTTNLSWLHYTEPVKVWKTFAIEAQDEDKPRRVINQFETLEDAKSFWEGMVIEEITSL